MTEVDTDLIHGPELAKAQITYMAEPMAVAVDHRALAGRHQQAMDTMA